MTEGYGPNREAIEALVKEGARLIVTVDCGTTGVEPLAAAAPLGAEVIVVDHHQAGERLPDVTAVINPNRQDDLSGLGHLCAAGVVFMVLVATARELRRRGFYSGACQPPDLLALLDLVGLATVCDVVPLEGLNRAYVTKGLQAMRQRRNAGLKALADAAGLAVAPTPYHLGGRIGDAALGARLLATDDEMEAARIAVLLDKLNRERKAIESRMLEEALARAEQLIDGDADVPLLLVAGEGWHKGVVGLVASRLTERFRRPSCVIAWEETGTGTGSLRSIDGVDIGGAVRAAVEAGHLIKGGGHAMAAGLTIERSSFDALGTFMSTRLVAAATMARAAVSLAIDGARFPGADRAGRPLRAGQSTAEVRLPRSPGEVRQGGGRGARALRSGGWRRLAPRCRRVPRRRPAGGRRPARLCRHAAARRRQPAPRHLGWPRPP
jgi:single-stranded-DNA-specific exonuclease